MNGRVRLSRGRADPFGLLVVAVMVALTITIGIQAQASVADGPAASGSLPACIIGCLSARARR